MNYTSNPFRVLSGIFTLTPRTGAKQVPPVESKIAEREVTAPELIKAMMTLHIACDQQGKSELAALLTAQIERSKVK